MTFFEVIYSPQKADAVAVFVWSCLLVTRSFKAIIFTTSPKHAQMHVIIHTDTNYYFSCRQNYILEKCTETQVFLFLIRQTVLKKEAKEFSFF